MRSPTRLATTRRTTMGGAAASLLTLAGCESGGSPPRTERSPGARATSTPEDPDSALVDRVVDELDELDALVRSAARRRPGLAPRLAGLAAAHREHRSTLTDQTSPTRRVALRGDARQVLAEVVRREQVGRDRLADWALAARSGALARLLASMSAGIAAHLATLAAEDGRA